MSLQNLVVLQPKPVSSHDPNSLLSARVVKARLGDVSDMTLYRWQRSRDLNFPQPLVINGRRYWRLRELEAWEATRSSAPAVAR
jgi:predicted DNA-binding transcriptional regulator AlpA